ncbi:MULTISPECIES: outer membrane beta-barrel protein [unclassified Carboxylicivirga]|uniref:outer membrane beta-barrel protein n=1 Tax=Carboxylicivirga TaxID=1628153 RepID=UPI003D3426D8
MRSTIIVICFLLSMGALNAQDKHTGVRVGYQSSVMMKDSHKYGSHGDGFYAAFYRDTKVLPFFFFNAGMEYSRVTTEIEKQDYKLDYLGIPLALKLKLGPIFAQGGAAINFKLNEIGNPFDDKAEWFDTNAFVGAGLSFFMLNVEAKYLWGLTEVHNGIKNNGLQLGIGLRF